MPRQNKEFLRLLTEATQFVGIHHQDQMYDDGLPYTVHLFEVFDVLLDHDASDDVLIAGILHDVLEDTPVSEYLLESFFGQRITEIVKAVTNPPFGNRAAKHEIQYPIIARDPDAVLVKLADRIANVESGGKTSMYRKEHPYFESVLRKEYSDTEVRMWDRLNQSLQAQDNT